MPNRSLRGRPDFEHLRRVLMRETAEGPVPLLELLADAESMSEVTGIAYPAERAREIFSNPASALDGSNAELARLGVALMDLSLEFSKTLGLDYVTMIPIVPLVRTRAQLAQTGYDRDATRRAWQELHEGIIRSRDDLEGYRWPSREQISIFPVEYAAAKMPEGMKVVLMYMGVFEDLKQLMGFETMAIASVEDPGLIDDILEELTSIAEYTVGLAAAHPATGAVFYGEDLGFSSGTLLSPKFLREHVIPRLQRIAAACHAHGKPFLLHSCGNVSALMDDFIDVVGIEVTKRSQPPGVMPSGRSSAPPGHSAVPGDRGLFSLARILPKSPPRRTPCRPRSATCWSRTA